MFVIRCSFVHQKQNLLLNVLTISMNNIDFNFVEKSYNFSQITNIENRTSDIEYKFKKNMTNHQEN
jgi:hypothetical protein